MECSANGCDSEIDIDGAVFTVGEQGDPIEEDEWFFDVVEWSIDPISIDTFILLCPECTFEEIPRRDYGEVSPLSEQDEER